MFSDHAFNAFSLLLLMKFEIVNKSVVTKFVEKFPKTIKNQNLAELTSIKIGGPADLCLFVKSEEELKSALLFCLENKIPFFILGWGKNVVFDDLGFSGVVIRLEMKKIEHSGNIITVEAGAYLTNVISFSHLHELSGLEDLAGIPTTIGGAIFGNAGAFGKTLTDFLIEVKGLKIDIEKEKLEEIVLSPKDLSLKYRESRIKKTRDVVFTSAKLKLVKGDMKLAKEKVKIALLHRKKFHPLNYPNAGCVFKNPEGKIAGKLIEEAGLKGLKIGGLQISEKHANFVVNKNHGSFKDYLKITGIMKEKVKEKFGIELETENIVVFKK